MRIFLYRTLCGVRKHEELEILRVRGYDAHCRCDIRDALGALYTREREAHAMATMFVESGAHMVITDDLAPDEVLDLVGWARLMAVPLYRYQDLPAVAPTERRTVDPLDLRVQRRNNNDLTVRPTLRERLRTWMWKLKRWEARANAMLGGALKNPMARNAPKPYAAHHTVSRTG